MEASQTPVRIHRSDYTPFAWTVTDTRLDVSINSPDTLVCVTLDIQPNPAAKPSDELLLNGRNLTLLSIEVDGLHLAADRYHLDRDQLRLAGLTGQHRVKVTSTCTPYTNTALEGLYLSGDMLCTQCEPEGFRRICYYPDRPDVMSVFTVLIEADLKYNQLLCNGNKLEDGPVGSERHFALWHDPHPKPCYLFALVAGDLALVEDRFTTASGRKVTLQIWVEQGNQHLTDHAMESLKNSMRWDEKVYGLEYDLDLFQIVAVSHFNMGAMENKGLNIFNSKFVLADPATATDDDLNRVESIIAHEYFHNWSGNRVTCRDWFQLTLKEGLTVYRDQCFTADLHDSSVKRIEDVSLLRSIQFPEDASPMAHPIRPNSYSEINNFYTPTIYEKGAEVIRMLATIFGKDGFRKGIDLYFQRHDGKAVTCDDFLSAMEDANKYDLYKFSRWYQQSGTPSVYFNRKKTGSELIISLVQKKPENASYYDNTLPIPFRFSLIDISGEPISLTVNGKEMGIEPMLVLDCEETRLKIKASDKKKSNVLHNAIPSLLRGFSAPIKLHDDLTEGEYLHLIYYDTDPFVIWDIAQRLYIKVISEASCDKNNLSLEAKLSDALLNSIKSEKFNDAFKALLLIPPSQSVLLAELENPDPSKVFFAKQNVIKRIATNISVHLSSNLKTWRDKVDMLDASGRSLHNQLLAWGVLANIEVAHSLALKQVSNSNMTLVKGAINALNNIDVVNRQKALDLFYDNWKSYPLVMENWFMWQSSSVVAGTPEKCKELMTHPLFDPDNPNKVRSVIGGFASGNPVNFHADDGSGYRFLADQLLILDKKNPQISARLALPLTRFSNLESKRRVMMIDILKKISKEDLSSDLSEVVTKSIGSIKH